MGTAREVEGGRNKERKRSSGGRSRANETNRRCKMRTKKYKSHDKATITKSVVWNMTLEKSCTTVKVRGVALLYGKQESRNKKTQK